MPGTGCHGVVVEADTIATFKRHLAKQAIEWSGPGAGKHYSLIMVDKKLE